MSGISWQALALQDGKGANLRVHYRPLPPNFFSRFAFDHGYHTWFELLDADGQELQAERRFVWGIYQGRHQEGAREGEHNGRAELCWMNWEYREDGGLARWSEVNGYRYGNFDLTLPGFGEKDFDLVSQLTQEDRVIDLGPYGYLLPKIGWLTGYWSCQRYVRIFAAERGGPRNVNLMIRERYGR